MVFAAAGLTGVSPPNFYIIAICEGIAGGALLKFRDVRISMKSQRGSGNVMSEQRGTRNTQTNQSNPRNSPVINRAGAVYIGGAPADKMARSQKKEGSSSDDSDGEWICKGHIQFEGCQEFPIEVVKGDVISGHVESPEPISMEIIGEDDLELLEDDARDEYEPYWESPKTREYDFRWEAPKKVTGYLVVFDECDESVDEGEAEATARIKVTRGISKRPF